MAEILCAGMTHHPGFLGPDANIAGLLRRTLQTDRVPEHLKNIANWPEGMVREWGQDQGAQAAALHRQQIWEGFEAIRQRIRDFNPDFIVIWGDDQYEQFREECVPPFNVFIFDEVACQPYLHNSPINPRERNYWGEDVNKTFKFRGHHAGASYLTTKLLEGGFDMSYSYRLREGELLPHSFLNTMLYLDYDRTGFDYPVVPFHVNCYGSTVIRSRGSTGHLNGGQEQGFDPISPTASRCFAVGRATARILKESRWRVAVVASSSWSHAFLTEKNGWIYPDMQADRNCYDSLKDGRYAELRDLSLADIEAAGQQEILNWCCLAGALEELGLRQPDFIDFVESYIFNSNKVMAVYPPA
jgi:hypothetical protein